MAQILVSDDKFSNSTNVESQGLANFWPRPPNNYDSNF